MRKFAGIIIAIIVAFVLGSIVASGAAQATAPSARPDVSEVFKWRQENLALKQRLELLGGQLQVCEAQLAPAVYKAASTVLEQERLKIIADFEAAHPGWTLDTATGTAVAKPVAAPKKEGGGV